MTPEQIDSLEAGRELDALIAEKVMALTGPKCEEHGAYVLNGRDFHPSTDITTAWQVVEKMRAMGLSFGFHDQAQTSLRLVGFTAPVGDFSAFAYAQSDALAICRAALKALKYDTRNT